MFSAAAVERVVRLYRRTAASRSALALIVANTVLLVGVVLLGWSLWTVLVLYWVENGIVGLWAIPRILESKGPEVSLPPPRRIGFRQPERERRERRRYFTAIRFTAQYGALWLAHGVLVSAILSVYGVSATWWPATAAAPGRQVAWLPIGLVAVFLFLSHGWSFRTNFIDRGEGLRLAPDSAAAVPYWRSTTLQAAVVLGGVAIALVGSPTVLAAILVVLKTALDLLLHLYEHTESVIADPTEQGSGHAQRT